MVSKLRWRLVDDLRDNPERDHGPSIVMRLVDTYAKYQTEDTTDACAE